MRKAPRTSRSLAAIAAVAVLALVASAAPGAPDAAAAPTDPADTVQLAASSAGAASVGAASVPSISSGPAIEWLWIARIILWLWERYQSGGAPTLNPSPATTTTTRPTTPTPPTPTPPTPTAPTPTPPTTAAPTTAAPTTAAPTTAAPTTAAPTTAAPTTAAPTTAAPTTAAPTTVPSEPAELPDGVTLVEPDGGADYFGRWSNSFPVDPRFFPVGVWAESFQDDQQTRDRMDAYRGMGINTFVEPYGWPESIDRYAAGKHLYSIGDGGAAKAASKTTDEPDWRGCFGTNGVWNEMSADHRARVAAKDPSGLGRECWTIGDDWGTREDGPTSPEFMQAWSDVVREDDPTRPVFNQHTKLARAGHPTPGVEDWWVDRDTAERFAAAADIVSNDWYIIPDPWTVNAIKTFVTDDPRYPDGVWVGNVWEEHDAAQRLRAHAGHSKPVWMFVSTSNGGGCDYYPTPEDVNAVVWNQLIGGARGIEYFNHDFCDQYGTTARALLTDHPYYRSIRAQVSETNDRIGALAPVLNADFAEGYASVAKGAANVMVKYHGGNWYVFAAPTSRDAQEIAIDLAEVGGGTAEVLFEDRDIDVSDGRLVDTFEDQNTVHIYRIRG